MSNPDILNRRHFPKRVDIRGAAEILGFEQYEISVLVSKNYLRPLGNPKGNAVRWFATEELLALDRQWLDKATRILMQYRKEKNEKARDNIECSTSDLG